MLKQLLLLMVLVTVLFSCHKNSRQVNAIVTLKNKVESINSITAVINETINEINTSPQYDNFILFVHGRGKHPGKAFNKHLLADLEKDYSAKVIMFHWPSWEGRFAFPTQKARNSSEDFLHVLQALQHYKEHNKEKVKDIKFTLFTNSMGSIVLEQAMLDYDGSLNHIFDNLLINASSSLAKNHSTWVDKINFSKQIYITINQDDKLLGKLGVRFVGKRLGKGVTSLFGNQFNLSLKANYIDVTKYQLNHRYYLQRDLVGKSKLIEFYNDVLNGLLPKVVTQCSYGKRNSQIQLL